MGRGIGTLSQISALLCEMAHTAFSRLHSSGENDEQVEYLATQKKRLCDDDSLDLGSFPKVILKISMLLT